MADDNASVVVIGNGPVGQTAALLLARRGVRVLLLDRAEARVPVGSRSICHQGHTLDIWDSVGVGRAIAEELVAHRDAEPDAVKSGSSNAFTRRLHPAAAGGLSTRRSGRPAGPGR